MHIISIKPLREFWITHPAAETSLREWLSTVEHSQWTSFAGLRRTYPSADQVGKYTVFNIGGNKFRLVVVVHFNRGKVYVRHVMTHKDYDRGRWNIQ